MAAGLGFKTFTTGEVLTAGDVNGYLMQGINVFASSAARASAITSPQEGQYSFLKDTNALEYYDGAAWVGAPVGDITAVTAGTGISGGGSSGDVTITNSMATAIDAKADLVVGTGADTFSRLAVGTNGQVLTADSTVSPTGLKWATAASSSGPAFSAYRQTSDQTIAASTFVKMQLNAEFFDTDSCYDSTTNYRFTPTTAGKYQIDLIGCVNQSSAGRGIYVIYKNGSAYVRIYDNTTTYAAPTSGGSVIIDMNGSSDYLEAYCYSNASGTMPQVVASGGSGPIFSGAWIRS